MKRRDFLMLCAQAACAGMSMDRAFLGANTAMAGYGLYDAIEALRRLGFPAIEIHPMGVPEPVPGEFPGFEFDRISTPEKNRIRKALEGFQRITTHLPYIGLNPFSADRRTAEASVHKIRAAMDATAWAGAELAVLHVIPPDGVRSEEIRPSMIQRIREWGDFAAEHRFKLAIETGYPDSVAGFVALVNEVNHPAVGCTIDVGHQGKYRELLARVKSQERATAAGIRAYNDTTHAIIDGLRDRILHFHIHDIDAATWREHRPIGTGFVDYPRLISRLREIRYRGLLIFEIAGPGTEIEQLLSDSKRKLEAFL